MIRPSALLPHACLPTAGSQIYGSQSLGDTLVAINAKKKGGEAGGTSVVTACTRVLVGRYKFPAENVKLQSRTVLDQQLQRDGLVQGTLRDDAAGAARLSHDGPAGVA